MPRNLLITGATGKQGAAVISALLASPSAADYIIYAVTRDPSSAAAQSLASKPNDKIVKGNLDAPAALFASAGVPIWGVFSVQVRMCSGPAPEQRQGTELVEAAVSHGRVKQFVYTSADRGGSRSACDPTDVPHFASKYNIEKYLEEQAKRVNMGYTILRPVAFMKNLTDNFQGKSHANQTLDLLTQFVNCQQSSCKHCGISAMARTHSDRRCQHDCIIQRNSLIQTVVISPMTPRFSWMSSRKRLYCSLESLSQRQATAACFHRG